VGIPRGTTLATLQPTLERLDAMRHVPKAHVTLQRCLLVLRGTAMEVGAGNVSTAEMFSKTARAFLSGTPYTAEATKTDGEPPSEDGLFPPLSQALSIAAATRAQAERAAQEKQNDSDDARPTSRAAAQEKAMNKAIEIADGNAPLETLAKYRQGTTLTDWIWCQTCAPAVKLKDDLVLSCCK